MNCINCGIVTSFGRKNGKKYCIFCPVEKQKDLCVQCHRIFRGMSDNGKYPICCEADCPNFGLLQSGIIKMNEFLDASKDTKIT